MPSGDHATDSARLNPCDQHRDHPLAFSITWTSEPRIKSRPSTQSVTNAIRCPSGDHAGAPWSPSPSVICSASPVTASARNNCENASPRQPSPSSRYRTRRATCVLGTSPSPSSTRSGSTRDTTTNAEPSGDHAISFTPSGSLVTCLASPPSTGITQTCFLSSSPGRKKASVFPSAESLGAVSPVAISTASPSTSDCTTICDSRFIVSLLISCRTKTTADPSAAISTADTSTKLYICSGLISDISTTSR